MSNIVQNLMDRLRPLVGLKGWDYCVLWKLSDDQRLIEWMDCCCAGTDPQNIINGGGDHDQELQFPPCRDVAFNHQHPRTKSCQLLSQLASSMPIDSSGNIYTQTLISNQPRWLNFSNNPSDSGAMEETVWTRVLIPVMGGLLIELLVTKEVCEDVNVIDFITSQCNISFHDHQHQEAAAMANNNNNNDLFPPPVSLSTALDNLDHVPYDISVDRIHLSSSTGCPMNLLQQFSYGDQNNRTNKNDHHHVFFEGSSHHDHDHHHNNPFLSNSVSSQCGGVHQEIMDVQYMDDHQQEDHHQQQQQQQQEGNNNNVVNDHDGDSFNSKQPENGRSDSVSDCSDQIDDEDDVKYSRRRSNGKGPSSKNLVAERKRRKKLNDRLYALRALVPKISKLDRASILGDAIEFVKELQKQAKELQDELEENSDDDGDKSGGGGGGIMNVNNNNNNVKSEIFSQNNGTTFGPKTELDHYKSAPNGGFQLGASGTASSTIPKHDLEISNDRQQQMEVQVEVAQLDGNAFFVKVFCEHKPGGFLRLMEALNSLGLEVTNANVTSYLGLVSNVFKVEKRDSEMVQADHVRDSLLELTRNPIPSRGWSDQIEKASEGINGSVDYHHHHDQHLHNHHIAAHHLHHHLHN
ncbi:hypothetical protein Q3G72_013288 [Acer saccharum]|nr:hypothetical protein Q3G72_013288 [Acer saccharum]